jgi:LEA14-like dessication related protein
MKKILIALIVVSFLSFSGCAVIEAILGGGGIKEPVVKIESVDFGNVSFESLDLLFNIVVENPNQLAISLSSFDYELLLNEKTFVRGDQSEGMNLEAQSTNPVQIPVSLTFRDILESVQSVAQQDSSVYQFKSGFAFTLPVIGDVRIPVQRSGTIPVVKIPSMDVVNFRINNISFTGAEAVLALRLKNPNSFSLDLRKMHYAFSIDGVDVLKGETERTLAIKESDESIIEIPVAIRFADFGQTIYRILRGDQQAQFRFTGSTTFDSSLDFFRNIPLNFDTTGDLPLVR